MRVNEIHTKLFNNAAPSLQAVDDDGGEKGL